MKKKIIAWIVAAAFCLGNLPFALAFPDNVVGTDYEYAVRVLSGLGIIEETASFETVRDIGRGDFYSMLIKLMGYDVLNLESTFPDAGDYGPALQFAYLQGMVDTFEDGTIRPQATVGYAEAARAVVTALGYSVSAQNRGGFPVGYLMVAAEHDLFQSVKAKPGENLTYGDAANLLYQALNTEIALVSVSTGGYEIRTEAGRTILTEQLGMGRVKGIIDANSDTALVGSDTTGLNRIRLDGRLYDCGDTNAKGYLGYAVELYYEEVSGERIVRAVVPSAGKNNILRLDEENAVTAQAAGAGVILTYSTDGTDSKRVRLNGEIDVIYNGKTYGSFTPSDFEMENGQVLLLDNNGDGNYDVAFLTEYITYIVDAVNLDTGMVYDKYGRSVNLQPESGRQADLASAAGPVSLESLAEYDILSVAQSKDLFITKAMITKTSITGTVEAVSAGDETALTLNGKQYELSEEFLTYSDVKAQQLLGMESTFFLDLSGKIVYMSDEVEPAGQYAYLADADTVRSTQLAGQLQIRLFTTANQFEDFLCEDRLNVDGTVRTILQLLEDGILVKRTGNTVTAQRQLVRYQTDGEGRLTRIDTARRTPQESEDTLTLGASSVSGQYNRNGKVFYTGQKTLAAVNDQTTVFIIPDSSAYFDKEEYYMATNLNYFNNDSTYHGLDFYDMDDVNVAKAVVRNFTDLYQVQTNSYSVLVEKVTTSVNETGESVQTLYGLKSDGTAYTCQTKEGNLLDGIEKGDVLRVRDRDGKITSVQKEVDVSEKPIPGSSIVLRSQGSNSNTFNAEVNVIFGYLSCRKGNYIGVSPTGGQEDFTVFDLGSTPILFYDEKNDQMSKISIAEAAAHTYDKNPRAKIYLTTNYGAVKAAILWSPDE